MKQVAIFGASGFGREVLPLLRRQLQDSGAPYTLSFVDDHPPCSEINGHAALTYAEWLSVPASERLISIAIANSEVRKQLCDRVTSDGVRLIEVRSDNVVQLDEVHIGEGAILCSFVTLTSNIRIGRNFHANIYSYVAHDCVIGDYVTFAPGVKCNGNIIIEDYAYIGTGAIIKQGHPDRPTVIGRGAVVGMGAVVTRNVASGSTVIGNPARTMEPR